MILALSMFLFAHVFSSFKARENSDIDTFLKGSTRAGIYMPIIFNCRLILLTILIFVYHVVKTLPSIMIIVLQIIYIFFVLLGNPHLRKFDFIRAICIEGGLITVFILRIF